MLRCAALASVLHVQTEANWVSAYHSPIVELEQVAPRCGDERWQNSRGRPAELNAAASPSAILVPGSGACDPLNNILENRYDLR